jgi:NO-binding membrane sensor protein with MHYT domain/serine phosphatase RsbU (regulator of sigma subunit)
MPIVPSEALAGTYDYRLVALTVLIAMLSSYAALELGGRVTASRGRPRAIWLIGGAAAMGMGIWSMHSIGMLAYRLPVTIFYQWPTVLLSLLASLLASVVALFVVSRNEMGALRLGIGGLLMGSGIAATHYVGMAAMRLPAMCHYSPGLVALSVVLAIAISLATLWLTFHWRAEINSMSWQKLASATLIGAASLVMHYTGTAAASLRPVAFPIDLSHSVKISSFGIVAIGVAALITLSLAIMTSLVDRRFSAQSLELKRAEEAAEEASRTKSGLLTEINALCEQLQVFTDWVGKSSKAAKVENARMSSELEITQRLQQMMLPREEDMRKIVGLDISGSMEPATEIGGDYYDVVCKDGAVVIGIGDVTGHGLESGVIAIMVQTAVRTLLASGHYESRKFFNALNRVIYDNVRRMNCDRNLTLSLLHYQDKVVTISGQHEEVLVVRGNGVLERHDTLNLGFPLGLEEDISSFIGEATVPLRSGDVMVAYTDGVTEAMNCAGVAFGVERLSEAVRSSHQQPAGAIREFVLSSLRKYIDGQNLLDDVSLLIIKPA